MVEEVCCPRCGSTDVELVCSDLDVYAKLQAELADSDSDNVLPVCWSAGCDKTGIYCRKCGERLGIEVEDLDFYEEVVADD